MKMVKCLETLTKLILNRIRGHNVKCVVKWIAKWKRKWIIWIGKWFFSIFFDSGQVWHCAYGHLPSTIRISCWIYSMLERQLRLNAWETKRANIFFDVILNGEIKGDRNIGSESESRFNEQRQQIHTYTQYTHPSEIPNQQVRNYGAPISGTCCNTAESVFKL